jgi:simple sugar transport system ATP-binding protein
LAESESGSFPALELHDVSKQFGNLQALSHVSFTLRPGTVHALLGENGAGKSTLMRIAFGMIEANEGEVRVEGRPVHLRFPRDAIALGIGMVHQHFMLVPAMTVAENIELGGKGRYNAREAAGRIKQLTDETGLTLDPLARVHSLSISGQQRLEIIKALAHHARILILDEPTAVLAPAEAQELLTVIRRLVQSNRSVVLITHKLQDAETCADDVSVLRHGKLVLSKPVAEVTVESLARAMLGPARTLGQLQTHIGRARLPQPSDTPVIRLENVGVKRKIALRDLRNINLEVSAGEIVGIAALDGAAADLLRVVAGRDEPSAGKLTTPLIVGFIPEDRQRDAIIGDFSVLENVALKDSGSRKGRIQWSNIRHDAGELIESFDIRAPTIDVHARALSGGNQQKLVLARELSDKPIALVAENPTRGLDIRAAADIHDRMRAAVRDGSAVLFYSSDIDELIDLADRVVVIRDGSMTGVERVAEAIGSALLRSSSPLRLIPD